MCFFLHEMRVPADHPLLRLFEGKPALAEGGSNRLDADVGNYSLFQKVLLELGKTPGSKVQSQVPRSGSGDPHDTAANLFGQDRGTTGSRLVLQPFQTMVLETVEPEVNRLSGSCESADYFRYGRLPGGKLNNPGPEGYPLGTFAT